MVELFQELLQEAERHGHDTKKLVGSEHEEERILYSHL